MPKLSPDAIEARKKHIIEAALTCFARKGFNQTTMEDIVQEAGLSKGGVYVHFASKKELYLAMYEWFMKEFSFQIPASMDEPTPYEQFTSTIFGMFTTITTEEFKGTANLMMDAWGQNIHDTDVNQLSSALYVQLRESLSTIICQGITEGTFKSIDANTLASIIIGTFEGLVIQAMIDEDAIDWQSVSGTLQSLIDGLLI
jgi:AcrR family transcriptional regulator